MLHSSVDTCSCLPIPIISLFLLNSWTKCTNLLINFSSQLQALAWYRVTAHSILTADMGICTSRRSSSLDGASFISSLSTNARNSELITYNSNVTLFFPHFLPPFFYAYSELFNYLVNHEHTFQQRHLLFLQISVLLSLLSKELLGCTYEASLKGYIQAHSVTGNCQKTFCSTAISFFWNRFFLVFMERKILSILPLQRTQFVEGR